MTSMLLTSRMVAGDACVMATWQEGAGALVLIAACAVYVRVSGGFQPQTRTGKAQAAIKNRVRSELDPVGGGHHLLRLHVRLVHTAPGAGAAADGDGHANQAAG